MHHIILNLTGTAGWQTLGADQEFPRGTFSVLIKEREGTGLVLFKFAARDEFLTIPIGGVLELAGKFDPGELEVYGGVGKIIEVMACTTPARLIR